jgi:uncharacterized membrane protein
MATQQFGSGDGLGGDRRAAIGILTRTDSSRLADAWYQNGSQNAGVERLARFLGWFSEGLGFAQVTAPRTVNRLIGVRDDDGSRGVMRAAGVREMTHGVGILSNSRPTGWVWTRVGGDVMDLALLARAFRADSTKRNRTMVATAAVLGVTALDVYCATQLRNGHEATETTAPIRHDLTDVEKAITINRPTEDVYRFWRNFQNLPGFMQHLESVQVIDEKRSHWKAKAPAGKTVEWDAEIIEDRPNELIAWRSLEGADVQNAGSVRFSPAPGGRGTEVRVSMRYDPPAGVIGATIAKLFGEEPSQQVGDELRRLKQVLETGEVVLSEAVVNGARIKQHPAQPPEQVPGR